MKRLYELDAIRSACFIWIVAVWHLNSYLMPSLHYSGYVLDIFHNITSAALMMFAFLSGTLLSKYEFRNERDIGNFYKKRLSKFFFLLLISAVSYKIVGWISTGQVVQIVTGTNLFIGPSVPTLWFFSMMVFLYIVTPLLSWSFSNNHQKHFQVMMTILILCIILASVYFLEIDRRLAYYYPMYVIGLFVGSERLIKVVHSNFLYFSFPLIILLFLGKINPFVAEIAGGSFFLLCGNLAFQQTNSLCRVVSVASMIAYLFHRQFFSLIIRAFEHQGIAYIPLGVAIVAFIVLVIICYYIQTMIDNLKRDI